MRGQTLYDKIFDSHVVREVSPGRFQLFVDLHLVNEISSPQAFDALDERGLPVRFPERTITTSDHAVATRGDPVLGGSKVNILQVLKPRDNAKKHGLIWFNCIGHPNNQFISEEPGFSAWPRSIRSCSVGKAWSMAPARSWLVVLGSVHREDSLRPCSVVMTVNDYRKALCEKRSSP